ncbi:MAG: carboxypeptidase-like regulatory domain-containing protein [Holophagales bacterium]|nr:carboxypeptidase-like regulatory domain-containing protein [Holophagales bacterium]
MPGQIRNSFVPVALALVALVAAGVMPAVAQRFTADLRGTITDPDGKAVQGAEVTVINSDTGLTRVTESNSSGLYAVGNLPVGHYVLEVSREGFSTAVITELQLNVADIRTADVELQVGAIADQVTVRAETLQVETVGGEVAGLITGEELRELPLNGRNFVQLTQLMPGVSTPEGFDTKNKGLLGGVDMSVSGGSVTGNLWTVDGAYNNDGGSNRTVVVSPSADAIEEFKIHRNSYGAEFGGAGGAQINIVTRGGSNDLHGSVYYFARDDSFNATNYFLEQSGQDTEPLSRDDYGYTLGGPILQDKLHFFISQEWNEEERGVVRTGFVPTAAERSGDFSGGGIPGCSLSPPNDPLTGSPFPGNRIPADRLSPAGLAFLNLYPMPNTNPSSGSCNNWVEAVGTPIDWNQTNARLDWNPNEKTRLMVRYTEDNWENGAPNATDQNGLWGDDPFPTVDSSWDQPAESLVAQLNTTLGSNAINTLQYSVTKNSISIDRGGTDPGLNGEINGLLPAIFPESVKQGGADRSHPVFWGSQGYAALWNIAPWRNRLDAQVLKDDYQQVFGDHWLKVGALYSDNEKDEFIGGASAFESPQFWGATGINGSGPATGNILADFLLRDMAFGFSENSFQPNPRLRWEDLELYVSDSWQVSSNVTLDFGVRYSRFFAPESADDNLASFDPGSFDPALGNDPCNGLLLVPGSTVCQDRGFLGGTDGPNASLVEDDTNNFAPRLGLAWDVFGDGRSALRVGVGQFYQRERVNIQLEFAGNPPFNTQLTGERRLDDTAEPCDGCFASNDGVPTFGLDVDAETPYSWQWNVTWEQRVGNHSTLEVGYVGSRGVHLPRRSDINQVPAGDSNGNGISDRLEYAQADGDAGARGNLRPISAFGDAEILFWENSGESEYHSLQAQWKTRFGRGSQVQASYTWSDFEANDPLNDAGASSFDGQILDRDNPDLDWGPAGLHREHVFNASVLWNLPELEGANGLVRALFGNWSIGGIVSYASGTPITILNGTVPGVNDPMGTGFSDNQRPNRVPGEPCRARGGPREQWLNPNAFTLTGYQLGTAGTSGIGECEGPDFFQVDVSFYKNIRLTDRFQLQLRLEVFNLFDEENFVSVNNLLDPTSVTLDADVSEATQITSFSPAGNFGQATAVRDPRQVQLGVKLLF